LEYAHFIASFLLKNKIVNIPEDESEKIFQEQESNARLVITIPFVALKARIHYHVRIPPT
jgi:hypothetical protein